MGAASLPRARRREGLERAFTLFPALAERTTQTPETLSGGEQQMVPSAGGDVLAQAAAG